MNMNKQEAIKGIEDEKILGFTTYEDERYNEGLITALGYIEQIDEPEKVVLTKEEAEWVDGLKKEQERRTFWTKYSMLYFITRAGFGYGFSYDHKDREIELKHYSHEIHAEKERLANAILYGYEVEKEKLYTVLLKRNGIGIGVQQDGSFKERFAKEELSEYGFDNLDEYEVKEVKE